MFTLIVLDLYFIVIKSIHYQITMEFPHVYLQYSHGKIFIYLLVFGVFFYLYTFIEYKCNFVMYIDHIVVKLGLLGYPSLELHKWDLPT